MTDAMILTTVFVTWVAVAVVAIGIHREVTGKFYDGFVIPAAFWPVFAVVGAGWCLLWLGRAPARIVIATRARRRLPRAIARVKP